MRYKIVVCYDGSRFHGFQRLNEDRTVQGELERVLSVLNKRDTKVKGASRTDIGVHAYGQVVHVDMDFEIPVDRFLRAMNDLLSHDIRVRSITKVSNDFHARHFVREKSYVYKIYTGDYDPFLYPYYLEYGYSFDLDLMKQASSYFIGTKDFRNFVSGERDNYVTSIHSVSFQQDGDYLIIRFVGTSFYRYMVRNLVGALLDVSRGKRSLEELRLMLEEPLVKRQMSTALPNGLYLEEINY